MKKSFYDKVYKVASKIPKGKVSTYKEIAKALNSKAYKAVGTAMNKNPHWPKVPCHRVINSNGQVGGFAEQLCGNKSAKRNVKNRARLGVSGTKKKISLLKKEGIKVVNGRVDLKKYLYKFK